MKLTDTWRQLFEARVSDRIEPIRKEYENEISRTGLDIDQRLASDAKKLSQN